MSSLPPEAGGTPIQRTYIGILLKVLILAAGLWYLEFAYQYYVRLGRNLEGSLISSFGLAGATLISLALLASIVFKFFPRLAGYWRIRRYLGVAGFVAISLHVLSALDFVFAYDLGLVYFSFNPFENAVVFGSLAFWILFVMAATSTDWMMRKLKRWWKFIHRFVYLAYVATIFHFLQMNPRLYENLPGTLLIVLVGLTICGQLYWWWRISAQRKFRNAGFYVGFALIVISFVFAYLVWGR